MQFAIRLRQRGMILKNNGDYYVIKDKSEWRGRFIQYGRTYGTAELRVAV